MEPLVTGQLSQYLRSISGQIFHNGHANLPLSSSSSSLLGTTNTMAIFKILRGGGEGGARGVIYGRGQRRRRRPKKVSAAAGATKCASICKNSPLPPSFPRPSFPRPRNRHLFNLASCPPRRADDVPPTKAQPSRLASTFEKASLELPAPLSRPPPSFSCSCRRRGGGCPFSCRFSDEILPLASPPPPPPPPPKRYSGRLMADSRMVAAAAAAAEFESSCVRPSADQAELGAAQFLTEGDGACTRSTFYKGRGRAIRDKK